MRMPALCQPVLFPSHLCLGCLLSQGCFLSIMQVDIAGDRQVLPLAPTESLAFCG